MCIAILLYLYILNEHNIQAHVLPSTGAWYLLPCRDFDYFDWAQLHVVEAGKMELSRLLRHLQLLRSRILLLLSALTRFDAVLWLHKITPGSTADNRGDHYPVRLDFIVSGYLNQVGTRTSAKSAIAFISPTFLKMYSSTKLCFCLWLKLLYRWKGLEPLPATHVL